jgi:hypothetical protein
MIVFYALPTDAFRIFLKKISLEGRLDIANQWVPAEETEVVDGCQTRASLGEVTFLTA